MIRRRSLPTILVLLATAIAPAAAMAHADLVSSNVTEGQTITAGSLPAFVATFSEDLAAGSKLELAGPGVAVSAEWKDGDGATMTLPFPDPLPAGTYEIRWTSVAPDGDVERGTIPFTVAAAPTVAPATAAPSAVPATPLPSPAPSPAGDGDGAAAGGAGDVLVPLFALAALLVLGGGWYLRSRRPGA